MGWAKCEKLYYGRPLKNFILWGWGKKNQYIRGGLPKKQGGLGQVLDLRGKFAKKRG